MIYWGDETGIDNCSNCERGFAPKGQPPVLPVDTKRERLNMFSALSKQGDIRFMLYEDFMNQQRLIQFMDWLVRTSNRKVFLILDNLKVHHGKKAAAWLGRHRDKIEMFFLPPYTPESNPDEYLNHALKLSIHSGDLPRTICDVRHKTASFMRTLQHCPDKVPFSFAITKFPIVLYGSDVSLDEIILDLRGKIKSVGNIGLGQPCGIDYS